MPERKQQTRPVPRPTRTAPIIGNRTPDIEAEARKLPRINPIVAAAIENMMMQDQGMQRRPERAARLLALIVALHKNGKPFPHREVAAEAIGGAKSKYTVDTALRNALADGYVSMTVETTPGNMASRDVSVRKVRKFIPSPALLATAENAIK